HPELILGLAAVELLAERLAHPRVGGHEDPRPRPVDARLPRAGARLHPALGVVLHRLLAEVPDVALAILRVPVVRGLLELAVEPRAVEDHGRGDPEDLLRVARDGELDAGLAVAGVAAQGVDGA